MTRFDKNIDKLYAKRGSAKKVRNEQVFHEPEILGKHRKGGSDVVML